MADIRQIDGLLILGLALVAVTVFSSLRGLLARSSSEQHDHPATEADLVAARKLAPQVVPLPVERRPHRRAA